MSSPSQSTPAAPSQPLPTIDARIGLIRGAADQLIPLFQTGSTGPALARDMALSAIAAYEPETRADYVNAARTIAFSMAALALLGKAVSNDMPMPELMRAYGRANALNRSADQSERAMMQRRRHQTANPSTERPAWMNPGSEATAGEPEIDDAEISAAVAEAIREFRAATAANAAQPAPAQPPPAQPASAQPEAPKPRPAAPPVKPFQPPAVSAIHYNAPRQEAAPARATYRQELLRNGATTPPVRAAAAPHAASR